MKSGSRGQTSASMHAVPKADGKQGRRVRGTSTRNIRQPRRDFPRGCQPFPSAQTNRIPRPSAETSGRQKRETTSAPFAPRRAPWRRRKVPAATLAHRKLLPPPRKPTRRARPHPSATLWAERLGRSSVRRTEASSTIHSASHWPRADLMFPWNWRTLQLLHRYPTICPKNPRLTGFPICCRAGCAEASDSPWSRRRNPLDPRVVKHPMNFSLGGFQNPAHEAPWSETRSTTPTRTAALAASRWRLRGPRWFPKFSPWGVRREGIGSI
jgi:hypothetical protein